jgi:hypothetical protein
LFNGLAGHAHQDDEHDDRSTAGGFLVWHEPSPGPVGTGINLWMQGRVAGITYQVGGGGTICVGVYWGDARERFFAVCV